VFIVTTREYKSLGGSTVINVTLGNLQAETLQEAMDLVLIMAPDSVLIVDDKVKIYEDGPRTYEIWERS
jgi:hypothetical protein